MINRAFYAIRRADVGEWHPACMILFCTQMIPPIHYFFHFSFAHLGCHCRCDQALDCVLAQKIADDGRACAIIYNKWDAVVEKESSIYDESVKYIRAEIPQLCWVPILFVSAETEQRVAKIYGVVDDAIQAHWRRIHTSVFNEGLSERAAVLFNTYRIFCHQNP